MSVGIVFGQLVMLFGMMLAGVLCRQKKWITTQSYKSISSIVVNVFNPLLILSSIAGKDMPKDSSLLWQNLALVVLMYGVFIAVSPLVVRLLRVPPDQRDMYRMMLIFSNNGFMGIPVVTALFSSSAVLYVAFYILIYNVLIYTYGVHLAGGSSTGGWRKMINPGTVSSLLAVLIYSLHIQFPSFINSFINYMGNAAIPLSMMMIGVNLAGQNLREVFGDLRMYLFTTVKMLVLPFVLVTAVRATGVVLDSTVFGVFVVLFGMPVGSIVVLLSEDCGSDSSVCSRGVAITTVLTLVTLPIVLLLLG